MIQSNRQHIVFVSATLIAILTIGVVFAPHKSYESRAIDMLESPPHNITDALWGMRYTYDSTEKGAVGKRTCIQYATYNEDKDMYVGPKLAIVWHGDGKTSLPGVNIDVPFTSDMARFCQDF